MCYVMLFVRSVNFSLKFLGFLKFKFSFIVIYVFRSIRNKLFLLVKVFYFGFNLFELFELMCC